MMMRSSETLVLALAIGHVCPLPARPSLVSTWTGVRDQRLGFPFEPVATHIHTPPDSFEQECSNDHIDSFFFLMVFTNHNIAGGEGAGRSDLFFFFRNGNPEFPLVHA